MSDRYLYNGEPRINVAELNAHADILNAILKKLHAENGETDYEHLNTTLKANFKELTKLCISAGVMWHATIYQMAALAIEKFRDDCNLCDCETPEHFGLLPEYQEYGKACAELELAMFKAQDYLELLYPDFVRAVEKESYGTEFTK